MKLRLSEIDKERPYESLTIDEKVGMVREHAFRKATDRNGRSKLDYDDMVYEVFDGKPGTKHCYKLIRLAAGVESDEGEDEKTGGTIPGFTARDPSNDNYHLAVDAAKPSAKRSFSREQSPARSSQNDGDIDETQFDAFEATTSTTSPDETIDAGEAFVDGWVARDTTTTVTLAASTAEQTVFLGWDISVIRTDAEYGDDRDAADTAIIGLTGDFDSLDPKVPLFASDTDGDGVTPTTDERQLGPTLNAEVGPEVVVQNFDRNRGTELTDGESVEIPMPVEDGKTLAVYR